LPESEARAYLEKVLAFPQAHPDLYSVDVHIPHNTLDSVQPSLKALAEEPTKEPHAQQRAEMPEAAVRPGPEPKPEERATETEGNTGEGFKTTGGRISDRFDQQVDQATRATASLKQDLDDYVLEGGNSYAAAAGATLLDAEGIAITGVIVLASKGKKKAKKPWVFGQFPTSEAFEKLRVRGERR
jgi:hypothetical protein